MPHCLAGVLGPFLPVWRPCVSIISHQRKPCNAVTPILRPLTGVFCVTLKLYCRAPKRQNRPISGPYTANRPQLGTIPGAGGGFYAIFAGGLGRFLWFGSPAGSLRARSLAGAIACKRSLRYLSRLYPLRDCLPVDVDLAALVPGIYSLLLARVSRPVFAWCSLACPAHFLSISPWLFRPAFRALFAYGFVALYLAVKVVG